MLKRTLAALACAGLLAAPTLAQAQSAGTLISAEPIRETPGGTQAWRVAYWTTDQSGRPQQVTGMVVAPREAIPASPRKVIAWAHGTSGVVERCAPSLMADFLTITPALEDMVRRGYVVVAPDYPGLGTAMPHPYLLGDETARSVLDAVRSARGIPGAAAGDRFAVWGESQGGHAALWTSSEARRYAPELTLVGTAAAAPPTDLAANFRLGSDANIRAMLSAFTLHTWSQRFGYRLTPLVNRTSAGVINRLAQNNCIELGKNPKFGTMLGVMNVRNALKGKDIARIPPWSGVVSANSVQARRVSGPLLIAQSASDPIVAPSVTLTFARQWCRLGRPLRYVRLPGGDHAHSARDSAVVTLDWIDARFAGAREANDCRGL